MIDRYLRLPKERVLAPVAKRLDISPLTVTLTAFGIGLLAVGAAALQHSMRDGRILSTIVGVTRPERVAQTLEWASATIPDEAWAELDALPRSSEDPEASRVYDPG